MIEHQKDAGGVRPGQTRTRALVAALALTGFFAGGWALWTEGGVRDRFVPKRWAPVASGELHAGLVEGT